MAKYFTIILFLLSPTYLLQAQLIEEWRQIYKGGAEPIRAVDSLHFGFSISGGLLKEGIVITNDGGNKWIESYVSTSPDSTRIVIIDWVYIKKNNLFFLADSIVTRGWDNRGNEIKDYKSYIYKSTDGGKKWQRIGINDEWRSRPSRDFYMSDSLRGVFVQLPSEYESSETSDQIYYTNDGWETWEKIDTPPEMKASSNIIYEKPKTIVTKTGGYNKIFITNDLGKNWQIKKIPDSLKSADMEFTFFNSEIYYLVERESGVVYKSENAGDDWFVFYDKSKILSLSVMDDSTVYLHSHSNPYYTTNGGRDWIKSYNFYFDNYERFIGNIIEFSENNKIGTSYGIVKYTGEKTLMPPYFTEPDSGSLRPLDFELGWTRIQGANRYHLQIVERIGNPWDSLGREPAPFDTTLFVNDSMISDTSYQLKGTSYDHEYRCRIRAVNDSLASPWIADLFWTKKETDVNDNNDIAEIKIKIFPNPFQTTTTIKYSAPEKSRISLYITNSLGIKVASLIENQFAESVESYISFDGSDLPSGVYFCNLKYNDIIKTKKIFLIK